MKKIAYSIFMAVLLMVSCGSPEEDTNTTDGSYRTTPVSGVVYGDDFTVGGGRARSINSNGVDSFYIYLTPGTLACDGDTTGAPIWIVVPAAVGEYTTNFSMQFRDDAVGAFGGATEQKIEITLITETVVKGRIRAVGFESNINSINGTFEVQYCPL